jgi:hypothetical protein
MRCYISAAALSVALVVGVVAETARGAGPPKPARSGRAAFPPGLVNAFQGFAKHPPATPPFSAYWASVFPGTAARYSGLWTPAARGQQVPLTAADKQLWTYFNNRGWINAAGQYTGPGVPATTYGGFLVSNINDVRGLGPPQSFIAK